MSEQGEKPNRPTTEDDWWSRLYDDSAPDTGPPAASPGDTLDDRFDSASDTVTTRPAAWWDHPAPPPRPAARGGAGPARTPSADPVQAGPPGGNAAAPSRPASAPDPRGADAAPPAAAQSRGAASAQPGWDATRPSAPPRPASAPAPRGADAARAPSAASADPDQEAQPGAGAPGGDTPALPDGPVADPRGTGPARDADAGPSDGATAPPPPARPPATPPPPPSAAPPRAGRVSVPGQGPRGGVVGDGPPTYDAEPTALPAADAHALDRLVPDTVLDGARYGTYTLRAASARGDSARFRGEPRRDALLTARFGTGPAALVFVAVAGGNRAAGAAHLAAVDACRWIGAAVGRSHARLAEDIRAGRRGDLKSGLHRLTDRSLGKLRARATELGLEPEAYTAGLRCLLLSADPDCRTRVFFGVGGGGLFRLRDGVWQDLEPPVPDRSEVTGAPVVGFGSAVPEGTPDGDRLTMDLDIPTPAAPYIEAPPPPPAEPFRFRASVARPGDTLLLCSNGLAEPVRGEAALAQELAERWRGPQPPGMAQFLADTQLRIKGYADDRTAVAVWEA
ncbi:protein phosphatase 2C domain-containing protein [Streptomyces sp. NPDC006274]|uniref:protein phosphatase 2C domain-containing protein n=1 Tax=unclassified Streptomyces TaxID=2593676 RepID=UPI0033A73C7F